MTRKKKPGGEFVAKQAPEPAMPAELQRWKDIWTAYTAIIAAVEGLTLTQKHRVLMAAGWLSGAFDQQNLTFSTFTTS